MTDGILNGSRPVIVVFATIIALFLPFIGWVAVSLVDIQNRIVRIETQVPQTTDDRYRRHDAESDFKLRDARIDRVEARLDRIETK